MALDFVEVLVLLLEHVVLLVEQSALFLDQLDQQLLDGLTRHGSHLERACAGLVGGLAGKGGSLGVATVWLAPLGYKEDDDDNDDDEDEDDVDDDEGDDEGEEGALLWFWYGFGIGRFSIWCCYCFRHGVGLVLAWFRQGLGMVWRWSWYGVGMALALEWLRYGFDDCCLHGFGAVLLWFLHREWSKTLD